MTDTKSAIATCLCGNVEISSPNVSSNVWACHCDMCRRWGGGPLLSVDCGTNVSIKGEDNIVAYSSSDWAERGFCKGCGSHLFYRVKENLQYFIPVGCFESDSDFILSLQVFIDEKPEYYSFSNETRCMTGHEAMSEFT